MSFSLCHFLFASKANYLLRQIAERLPLFLDLFIFLLFFFFLVFGEGGLLYLCLHADRSHQIVPQGRQSRLSIVGTVKREECYCLLMQIGVKQEVKCRAESQRTVHIPSYSFSPWSCSQWVQCPDHILSSIMPQDWASCFLLSLLMNGFTASVLACRWGGFLAGHDPDRWCKTLRKVLSHPWISNFLVHSRSLLQPLKWRWSF